MTATRLHLVVDAQPVQQGSKNMGRHGQLYDARGHDLKAWRTQVANAAKGAARRQGWALGYDGAVRVDAVLYLPRPGRTKFGGYPAGPPDADKLQRSVGDALTQSRVLTDDARIVRWVVAKEWADRPVGGMSLTVTQLGTVWVPFDGLDL